MRIAHIADIHFRGMSRHTECIEVFSAFVEKIKKQKVDHIFVGGDIFHTKTQGISPEFIDLFVWWVTEMSSVCDVHLTLGNHDGNLLNSSRQDAISPIVSALNNPKVHLYKKSGVYSFAPGYNWCVFSLFDEESWDDVKPIKGDINIACFHGSVRGAQTESDWEVEGGIPVDFFKDYQFCMLGDIHKLQFLDYRDCEIEIDECDLGKYPGAEVVS
jgi:hypothetical protein